MRRSFIATDAGFLWLPGEGSVKLPDRELHNTLTFFDKNKRRMSTVFISDLHLSPDDSDLMGHFQFFLENLLPKNTRGLYILGDIFEYWLGDDSASYLSQTPVEQSLKRVSDAGIDTFLMRGNRDFLLGEAFCDRTGCRLIEEPHFLDDDHQRALLLHGDSLCTDDIEHQKFRTIVRSLDWQKGFLEKTISERNQLALQVRYRSEQGKSIKSMDIMDVNARAVTDELDKAAVRLMIHGHTHRPDIHRTHRSDGTPAFRVVLGDWSQGPSYAELAAGRLTLHHAGSCREIEVTQ